MLKRDFCGANASGSFKRDGFGLGAGTGWGFKMDVGLRIIQVTERGTRLMKRRDTEGVALQRPGEQWRRRTRLRGIDRTGWRVA